MRSSIDIPLNLFVRFPYGNDKEKRHLQAIIEEQVQRALWEWKC